MPLTITQVTIIQDTTWGIMSGTTWDTTPVITPATDPAHASASGLPQRFSSRNIHRPVAIEIGDRLDALMLLFQQPESAAAYDVLQSAGTPELQRIFHALASTHDPHTRESLMMALKILAMYQTKQGAQCVVEAARKPFLPNNEFWGVVLDQFDLKHPQAMEVMRQLSTPLPPGMIGVALLDMANELESEGDEFPHPFDTEAGMARGVRSMFTPTRWWPAAWS